jgi:hypothetical protein
MVWWDREFEHKMKEIGLRLWMYKRYVDDVNSEMSVPKMGLRFEGSNLVEGEVAAEEDRLIEPDERAMRLFKSIADSIHTSIEMDIDCSSCHDDHKLPILDFKVWIEEREEVEGQLKKKIALHVFYSKEVASKSVVNARSALSWNSKRTILTQEVLRILLNCRTELPWEVVVGHVNHMMMRPQFSGYNAKFRTEVVKSALEAYDDIQRLDSCGEKPMYRPRQWRRVDRAQEKRKKRDTWYKKGGYESVIFAPVTPKSILKQRYEREVRRIGLNIKIVEQSGVTLKRQLQRSNPFKEKLCQRQECLICQSGGKGECNATGVTYELVCQECKDKYIGETSRSVYSRGKEHLHSLNRREEQSVMWRHAYLKHGGDIPSFLMNVTGIFRDDAMLRQITEAVLIGKVKHNELINTKNE